MSKLSADKHRHRLWSLVTINQHRQHQPQHPSPRRMSAGPSSNSGQGGGGGNMSMSTGTLTRRRSSFRRNSAVMNFNNSLFGQYREDLSDFRRKEIEKQQLLENANRLKENHKEQRDARSGNRVMALIRRIFQHEKGDLALLAILAMSMATLSFTYDRFTTNFYRCKY